MTLYQTATNSCLFSGGFADTVSFTTSYARNDKPPRACLNWTRVQFPLGLMETVPISTKIQFDPHVKVHHLMQ